MFDSCVCLHLTKVITIIKTYVNESHFVLLLDNFNLKLSKIKDLIIETQISTQEKSLKTLENCSVQRLITKI